MPTRKTSRHDPALDAKLTEELTSQLDGLDAEDRVEAIAGVPFLDEDDTLPAVVETAVRGLDIAGLAGRSAVVCAGPNANAGALGGAAGPAGPSRPVRVQGLLLGAGLEGRGFAVRALMEAAVRRRAPLVLLVPNLYPQPDGRDDLGLGFSPSWIPRLLEPVVEHDEDLALAWFTRHPLANSVESLLAFPLISGIFGARIRQPMPSVCCLSYRMLRSCVEAADERHWPHETGTYGIDPWLTIHAIAEDLSICRVPLGAPSFRHGVGKLKMVFRQVAHLLLEQVVEHSKHWLARPDPVRAPHALGARIPIVPDPFHLETDELFRRFRLEFDHFNDTLFREIVPPKLHEKLVSLADGGFRGSTVAAEDWQTVVHDFLLAYRFDAGFHPDDIVDGLFPFYVARLIGLVSEYREIGCTIDVQTGSAPIEKQPIVDREVEHTIERQADLFAERWPAFRESWRARQTETAPYLPRIGAWEFVPHVGVAVPQEIDRPGDDSVWSHDVYQALIERYRSEFERFCTAHLEVDRITDSGAVLAGVHRFMRRLDWALDVDLLPGDMATVDGARSIAEKICEWFAEGTSFQLTPGMASHVISQAPPRNLITQLGCHSAAGLLERYDPNTALCLAAWTDRRNYLERVLDLIEKDGQPEWFHEGALEPVVLDLRLLTDASEVRGTAALARLAGRVMVGNYQKGWGGEFPKLWFFLKQIKSIVGVELFAGLWQRFAAEEIDFPERLVTSIRGHWGRHVLSAHNAFENRHQRIVAERLERFAERLRSEGSPRSETGELLAAAASVYHLSITLPDNTFVPLSAWTWASYSNRGGLGAPTPLSSLVERDWSTRDFLAELLERAGLGDGEAVDAKVVELIGEGRESEDLGEHLLGVTRPTSLFVTQHTDPSPPPAGKLVRPVAGPILEPIAAHSWESQYVLNAGAVRLDGRVFILYRAFGDDEISRIGLAWSRDGIHIDGRLAEPIFSPAQETENAGCEDPRVTAIGDRLYMLYTAWDRKLPQIAMASIPIDAFLEQRFDAWERHGLGFPGLPNKDAVLFPERFDGRWVVYHRIDPNLWISYLNELKCPWPREGQKIVVGPRPGMMWDGVKLGAGAQPLKTSRGWLNVYHGVDYERSYRLGVLLTALDDPANVIYRSPNPILEPEVDFEIGRCAGRDYWVPHVVFTCGAVPAEDKDVLELDDEILVYYGAADTAIGVARGRLRDLVPVLG